MIGKWRLDVSCMETVNHTITLWKFLFLFLPKAVNRIATLGKKWRYGFLELRESVIDVNVFGKRIIYPWNQLESSVYYSKKDSERGQQMKILQIYKFRNPVRTPLRINWKATQNIIKYVSLVTNQEKYIHMYFYLFETCHKILTLIAKY